MRYFFVSLQSYLLLFCFLSWKAFSSGESLWRLFFVNLIEGGVFLLHFLLQSFFRFLLQLVLGFPFCYYVYWIESSPWHMLSPPNLVLPWNSSSQHLLNWSISYHPFKNYTNITRKITFTYNKNQYVINKIRM